MRTLRLISLFFALSTCFTQGQTPSSGPAEEFSAQYEAAHKLAALKQFAQAAQILQRALHNPALLEFQDEPAALYDLACYEALAGERVEALDTLHKAALNGLTNAEQSIEGDRDLTSLHGDPVYLQVLAIARQRALLWKSNPVIATPYRQNISEDEKVAGLSTFWSEAKFNFPFFARHPETDLSALYMTYLPQVRATRSTDEYYRVMMRFAAELQDGHTNVYPPEALQDSFYARPGLRTRLIEGKVVVTEVLDRKITSLGISEGLIITEIDGHDAVEFGKTEVAPYVSASAEQDRDLRTFGYQLLSGPADKLVTLTFLSSSGALFTRTLPRLGRHSQIGQLARDTSFRMLSGDVAYLVVNQFENNQGARDFREHFAEITNSRGLIIDLRSNGGGDSDNANELLGMLTDQPFTSARWRTVDYRPTFRAWGRYPGWYRGEDTVRLVDARHLYQKPVVLLIGPETFSAGEDFVAAFEGIHRGTLIGLPTGGSTGQPLSFPLPGGGSARICTLDETGPEGQAFEGVGIQPQVLVQQKIADIRTGIDVTLETAQRQVLYTDAKPYTR